MYLSLLKGSYYLLLLMFFVNASAETFFTEGKYFYQTNISEEECYNNAKKDAIRKVMENAGFSYITSSENLSCVEIKDINTCEYFQESYLNYDGGYLISKKFSNKKILFEESINRQCSISLDAKIKRFKSNHDPNYILYAKLNNNIFRNSEDIIIQGETNISSNFYLFIYDEKKEEFNLLMPNQFESLFKIVGKFKIPSSKLYSLKAQFPIEHNKDIIQEQLLLLVTKNRNIIFEVINNESSESLFNRLNDLGRENWKKMWLSYFIAKE